MYTGLALGSCGLVSWLLKRSQRRQFLHKRKGLSGYEQLIGNTPMIRLGSLSVITGCEILAKVEFLNPGGTGKDRIAVNMIREAEVGGKLGQEGRNTVLEGSSGSTGISLAALCRSRGYKCKVVLPDDQVREMSVVVDPQTSYLRTFRFDHSGPVYNLLSVHFVSCDMFYLLSGR